MKGYKMYKLRTTPILLCAIIYIVALPPMTAYNNQLPPAGFQSLTSPGPSSALPHVSGVHLSEGQDRPANSPAEVYNPGEPAAHYQLVRWDDNKKMHLKVWISPGLKLPDVSFDELQSIRVDEVKDLLNSPTPLQGLTVAPGWDEHTNDVVAAGIEQWQEFEKEGLFVIRFVDDPRQANILVFFTDSFKDTNTVGGVAIGGNTSAQIYPIAQARSVNILQKPVVIELSTMVNRSDERMEGAAAHEFGHALGIKAHSDKRQDIMFADRIVMYLSPSDKATIRYLYHQPPAWVM